MDKYGYSNGLTLLFFSFLFLSLFPLGYGVWDSLDYSFLSGMNGLSVLPRAAFVTFNEAIQ